MAGTSPSCLYRCFWETIIVGLMFINLYGYLIYVSTLCHVTVSSEIESRCFVNLVKCFCTFCLTSVHVQWIRPRTVDVKFIFMSWYQVHELLSYSIIGNFKCNNCKLYMLHVITSNIKSLKSMFTVVYISEPSNPGRQTNSLRTKNVPNSEISGISSDISNRYMQFQSLSFQSVQQLLFHCVRFMLSIRVQRFYVNVG